MFCNLCYSLVVVLVLFHTNFQLCRLLSNSGIFWKSLLLFYDLRNRACKWVTNYVVASADNRHDFRSCVSFTEFAFYIVVRCGFDKHLYLTSCLNAHNHNTCIPLPQTGYTVRKMALFIISQDRQTQDSTCR